MVSTPLRIAWLTTGRGRGSYGALEYLLAATAAGLPGELGVAFGHRGSGEYEATDRPLGLRTRPGVNAFQRDPGLPEGE